MLTVICAFTVRITLYCSTAFGHSFQWRGVYCLQSASSVKIHVIANTIIHSLHTLELKQSAGYLFGVTMVMAVVLVFTPSLPFTFITSCNVQMTETNQASRARHNWPLFLTLRSCSCSVSYRDAAVAETAKSVTREVCVVRKLPVEWSCASA